MNRIFGILVLVLVLWGLVLASDANARSVQNHRNIAERLAMYGILTVGVGLLIVSGGIDLSIGSVFCLGSIAFALLLKLHVPAPVAVLLVLSLAVLIGTINGLLVTRLNLQPFIVTLCGLFIYRGLAYWLALPDMLHPKRGSAGNVGIGDRASELEGLIWLSTGEVGNVPVRLFIMLGVAFLGWLLLQRTVYGRYLYAIGSNEQAARYAGIATDRYKILAYVICSCCAVLAGMLEMLQVKSASPSSTGNLYELYAITGAVLGGCSLRGGDGTVLGMILGAAVLPLLRNLINFSPIPNDLEYTVIGAALLLGTIADELLKRRAAKRG